MQPAIQLALKSPNDDQAIGWRGGGFSTKIHARCDALGNPISFHHTADQDHDLVGIDALVNEMTKAGFVLADKALWHRWRYKTKAWGKRVYTYYSSKIIYKDTYKARHLDWTLLNLNNIELLQHAKIKQFRILGAILSIDDTPQLSSWLYKI